MEREEIKLEPYTLLHDILINWWVILLGAIAAALMTYVVLNERYVPRYTTSATFAVSPKDSSTNGNWGAAYEMAETLDAILESNTMKKIICQELEIDSVNAQISAEILGETNLLILKVTAGTSKEAMDVIRVVMNNYTQVSYYALGDAVMDVLAEPEVPVYPDNPLDVSNQMKRNFFLATALLIFSFGLVSYLKDTVKQEKDIENKLDARNLGVICYERKYKTLKEAFRRKKSALLVNNPVAGFAFVEGYKKLATKVDFQMNKYDMKAIVVTSVAENEGKSTVAANLAISLAEQSKKVILVEGDLRRPSQFLIFESDPSEKQEIGEYLTGNTRLKDILQRSKIPNLYLMVGRNCYSSSTEIISSARMEELLMGCREIADYVIIDSPPAGLIGDAEILAEKAGAVILVTKQNYMLAEDVNEVLDSFREHHSRVLGVVLNGVRTLEQYTGAGGYYGRYGKYGKYANYARNRGDD